MDELAYLVEYCRKLGASAPQAEVMARQLWKRAGQLAAERHQSPEEALTHLLRAISQGQHGELPGGPPTPENRRDH